MSEPTGCGTNMVSVLSQADPILAGQSNSPSMQQRRDDYDGRDGIFGGGGGMKNIVTIDTTVTEAGAKSRRHTCGWRLPRGNTIRTP